MSATASTTNDATRVWPPQYFSNCNTTTVKNDCDKNEKQSGLAQEYLRNNNRPSVPAYPSLLHYGAAVLRCEDACGKAALTRDANAYWHAGILPLYYDNDPLHAAAFNFDLQSAPARPPHLQVLAGKDMPKVKTGVEHHGWNRLRLIHSLCHIESYAIDLSWDIMVRFATGWIPNCEREEINNDNDEQLTEAQLQLHARMRSAGSRCTNGVLLPLSFYVDWLRIASEEASHFTLWHDRLVELDSSYGAMPVHNGLWQSADETAHSLLARLAVVHAVHEARGLDQAPKMLQQLATYGDKKSVELLKRIEVDELTHVTSGLTWFKYICARSTLPAADENNAATATASPSASSSSSSPSSSRSPPVHPLAPIPTFHSIVRQNFRGSLLPPFNVEARNACGFTPEWYLPLAVKKEKIISNQTPQVSKPHSEPAGADATPIVLNSNHSDNHGKSAAEEKESSSAAQ